MKIILKQELIKLKNDLKSWLNTFELIKDTEINKELILKYIWYSKCNFTRTYDKTTKEMKLNF